MTHKTQKEITQEWLEIHPNSVHLSRAGLFSKRERSRRDWLSRKVSMGELRMHAGRGAGQSPTALFNQRRRK